MANGEEFLPPLQVLAAADCNIVPNAVSGLGNRTRLEQTVGVSQTALDTGILAVNVEDAALQSTSSRDRVSAEDHHVGRVEVDAEHRVGSLAQLEQGRSRPNHRARELLDSDVLDTALLAVCDELIPELDGYLPLVLVSRSHKVRPGNGRGDPVRGGVGLVAGRQTSHGNDLLDAQQTCQRSAVVHGLLVFLAGLGRPKRVAGRVQSRDAHAALLEFAHEFLALAFVREQLRGVAVLAGTPAACGHLDRVDTEGLYLVKHVRVGQISEYVSANCEFHIKNLTFLLFCCSRNRWSDF